jgi:hypothetical protein
VLKFPEDRWATLLWEFPEDQTRGTRFPQDQGPVPDIPTGYKGAYLPYLPTGKYAVPYLARPHKPHTPPWPRGDARLGIPYALCVYALLAFFFPKVVRRTHRAPTSDIPTGSGAYLRYLATGKYAVPYLARLNHK